jgi:hypothetical protein
MRARSVSEFTSPFGASATFGVGEEASRVETYFTELQEHALGSVVLGKQKGDALDELYAAFSESCAPGWDGYDASSASYDSYLRAKRFIEALPANFPAPEVAVDPDGEVSLEWYCPTGRVFSVSIGVNDGLTYAGKFSPSRKTHGTEVFTSQIPQVILDNIRRVMA